MFLRRAFAFWSRKSSLHSALCFIVSLLSLALLLALGDVLRDDVARAAGFVDDSVPFTKTSMIWFVSQLRETTKCTTPGKAKARTTTPRAITGNSL